MLEKTLQDRVVGRAKRRKWVVAHAGRGMVGTEGQIVTPMLPGWPDLFLLRPPRALAIELKRETGVVDDKQWVLLTMLNQCGIPAVVIRPSDLREGRVDAILA